MSDDRQVPSLEPSAMSMEVSKQQKAAFEELMAKMVEKALASNLAKEHDKVKRGPGAVQKQVEKDHSEWNIWGLLGGNRVSLQRAVKD